MQIKCFVALFCFACIVFEGNAQDHWSFRLGGLGADHVADIKKDAAGDLLVTGEFSSAFNYDGQSFTAAGQRDIFAVKLNTTGGLVWLKTAGGTGNDKGTKVCPAADGSVIVVGQFMGTANVFDTVVYSAFGTPDVFIAKLDGATGQRLWVRTAGSNSGGDRPYGVTVSTAGQVTVVGDFKGEMWFDNTMISSMPDPLTLIPGYDVFVATYSAQGDLLWVKHGAAKYTDRAIDVVNDPAGNVFVAGQFSDTIAFDLVHDNAMYNATFLIEFSPTGQELGFVRYGGGLFNHVRDMLFNDQGGLLITGDLRGNLLYRDDVPDLIIGDSTYSYYILKVGTDLQLQASTTKGSAHPITAAGVDLQGDSIVVLGTFACGFSKLQEPFGDGVFMATGKEDLFIARHSFSGLAFTNAQQFGGVGPKRGGAVAWDAGGEPVFCGSFTGNLVFPSDGTIWPGTFAATSANSGIGTYCGDPNYGRFVRTMAAGQQDGFIAKGHVLGRAPYDQWPRTSGGACERASIPACIVLHTVTECRDSVSFCYPIGPGGNQSFLSVQFYAPSAVASSSGVTHNGSGLNYLWTTGATTETITPQVSGWYGCTISTSSGCPQVLPPVYVTITPYPTILLSDGMGVNVDAAYLQTIPLTLCDTTTFLWPSTLLNVDSVQWYVNGDPVPGDTIPTTVSGLHTVLAYSAGCSAINSITVGLGSAPVLPELTGADFRFYFNGQPLDQDSVTACFEQCISGTAGLTWYENGVPTVLAGGTHMTSNTDLGCLSSSSVITLDSIRWSATAFTTGWAVFTTYVTVDNAPCGSDMYSFTATDSIYINVVDRPSFDPPGNMIICQGDTLQAFVTNCVDCDSLIWTGPGVIGVQGSPDTAYINVPGVYHVQALHIDQGLACGWPVPPFTFFVDEPFPVTVEMQPIDGQVCPGDSVLLFTSFPGTGFQWTGPDGVLADTSASVYVTETGEYYLDMIDPQGCLVSGGPVLVGNFGTPYLYTGLNDNVICAGETITVQVVAPATAVIEWQPPLSGNSLSQTISDPGFYTCHITSCGITTFASITILGGTANATIPDPGPFTLCEGDTLLITAYPGQAYYVWEPVHVESQFLQVTEGGMYTVTVIDDLGCSETGLPVQVDVFQYADPLSATDTTVCAGSQIQLTVSGSGSIMWYANAQGTQLLGTGATLDLGMIDQVTTVFVSQAEGPCTSAPTPIQITPIALPGGFTIQGNTSYCEGEDLFLEVNVPNSDVTWITPNGNIPDDPLSIIGLNAADAGSYTVQVALEGCAADPVAVLVEVLPCDLEVPNVFTPNGDGYNDIVFLEGPGGATLGFEIFNRWGQRVADLNGPTVTWNGRSMLSGEVLPTGTYFYVLTINDGPSGTRRISGYIELLR